MDIQEIRAKSEGDLRSELTELLQEQFNLRMQKGTGQLAQPMNCVAYAGILPV